MRIIPVMALASLFLVPPAHASGPSTSVASDSHNPWVAAGLTLSAVPAGILIGTELGQHSMVFQPTVLATPLLSAGHLYAGDPMRGLAFSAGSIGLFLATAASYVYLYGGRSFRYSETPPWQAGAASNIVTGYYITSVLYTTWAAWDAYRIAEEKNRAESQPLVEVAPVSTAGRLGQ